MSEPLRPMSTGQLLDHTFALYRKNLLLFVGIATVGPAASVLFQLFTVGANVGSPFSATGRIAASAAMARFGVGIVLGYIVLLAGMAISHAATVKAVAAVHLGHETSVVGAYKALHSRIWRLFGTCGLILLWMMLWMILSILAISIVVIPFTMAMAAMGRAGRLSPAAATAVGIVMIVTVVLAFAGFIAIYIRYALAVQACVVEDLGPRASIKRSIQLSKGSRSRVVAIYLVFFLLSLILGAGLGALAGSIGGWLHNKIAAAVMIYLAGFVAGSLTGPLATIGLSLLYYDERVRKEAFDLQLMLASLDPPEVPIGIPAQV